jgi:CubicO group peptidase (beta-lactamase class C family)
MRTGITSTFLAAGFSVCATIALGQEFDKISARTRHVIDSTYNSLMKKHGIVGASLAIVDNGEIVYASGYGFENREDSIRADVNTVYRIGSCTKSFTALAVMQQQERELMNVNAPLNTYIPELAIASRFDGDNAIYVRDVLTHTSGLPCDVLNGFFCDSPPDVNWLVAELNRQTTIAPRNYTHAYSNVGYGLLGEAISRTSGRTYSDYVKQNIFSPLEMTSSFIDWDEASGKRYSKGYAERGVSEAHDPIMRDQGAGLIHSTVIDMSHYLMMYLNNGKYKGRQIADSALLREMERNQVSTILDEKVAYGYALDTRTYHLSGNGDSTFVSVIGHGGDTYVYHADFEFIPELGVGAVILTNTDNGTSMNSALRLIRLYLKTEKGQNVGDRLKATTARERTSTWAEAKGVYNLNSFVLDMSNPRKMKVKQGNAKIIFKAKHKDSADYQMKVRLLGFITLKIPDQEMRFVTMGDNVYAKSVTTKTGSEEYVASRQPFARQDESWNRSLGTYVLTGEYYPCAECAKMNADGAKAVLSEDNGFLRLAIDGKSLHRTFYLDPLSPEMAVTGGIGRGTGETVKLLENGNLYYSGYQFAKESPAKKGR